MARRRINLKIFETIRDVTGSLNFSNKFYIPQTDVWPAGLRLFDAGKYAQQVRLGIKQGDYDEKEVERLIRLGFEPNYIVCEEKRLIRGLKWFLKRNGHTEIGPDFKITGNDENYPPETRGLHLGGILWRMANLNYLPNIHDYVRKLGFNLNRQVEFEFIYRCLIVFKARNQHVNVPPDFIINNTALYPAEAEGLPLGKFVESIANYDNFAEEREKLEELGIDFQKSSKETQIGLDMTYRALKAYKNVVNKRLLLKAGPNFAPGIDYVIQKGDFAFPPDVWNMKLSVRIDHTAEEIDHTVEDNNNSTNYSTDNSICNSNSGGGNNNNNTNNRNNSTNNKNNSMSQNDKMLDDIDFLSDEMTEDDIFDLDNEHINFYQSFVTNYKKPPKTIHASNNNYPFSISSSDSGGESDSGDSSSTFDANSVFYELLGEQHYVTSSDQLTKNDHGDDSTDGSDGENNDSSSNYESYYNSQQQNVYDMSGDVVFENETNKTNSENTEKNSTTISVDKTQNSFIDNLVEKMKQENKMNITANPNSTSSGGYNSNNTIKTNYGASNDIDLETEAAIKPRKRRGFKYVISLEPVDDLDA